MSTIITHADGTITPEVVNGFEATRPVRNIVHTIMGRPDPDITMRPAGLRRGQLRLIFATGDAAASAEAVLATSQAFTLSDDDVPQVAMTFVVAEGDISMLLDEDTQTVWIVTAPFQEIAP